jgi:hypothetical protein
MVKGCIKYAIIVLFVPLCYCQACRHRDMKSIELLVNYPVVLSNGSFFNLRDTIVIFYYENYILYQLFASRSLYDNQKQVGTEPYFLYRQQDSMGFLFSSLKDRLGKQMPVDSFLSKRGFLKTAFDYPQDSLWFLNSMVSVNNYLLERYVPRKDYGVNSVDSIYYYFNNEKFTEYSLSKKMDSIKKMKLFKVRFIFNEKYSSADKVILPKRELLFEIKQVKPVKPTIIIDFIELFKKHQLEN